MKKFTIVSLVVFLFAGAELFATPEAGKTLMQNTGCMMCHKPVGDQLSSGMGPSFKTIQEKYGKDGKAALISFFKGDSKPIIAPEKFSTMKSSMLKTKKMTDAEREAMVEYIYSEHK